MRHAVLSLALLSLVVPAFAGQASALYEDPSRQVRLRVTISDPRGEIGLEHFEALKFHAVGGATGQDGSLRLSAESASFLPPRGAAQVRSIRDESGQLFVDWSDVRAEVRIESVAACIAGVYGEAIGTLSAGKSGFIVVENTMAHVSVLTTIRGDTDLYIYDALGSLVCASQVTRQQRLPDQCAYLASDCGTAYIPQSLIGIRGLRKRNDFRIMIWAVDAI